MREAQDGTLEACENAGYTGGPAAGLGAALAGAPADAAPCAIAALPASAVPAGSAPLPHAMAAREGIVFVRTGRGDRPTEPGRRAEETALAVRLGAARLGVTRRTAERVISHLAARTAAGEPVIRKQLVQGVLADARVTEEVTRHALRVTGGSTAAVIALHDRLTLLDWELTKLLGASGYAGESAAREVFVSRLTANCWLPRECVA